MFRTTVACLMILLAWAPARGQDDDRFESVDLRVSSVGTGGTVLVDRGQSDGVQIGDRVIFRPREGGVLRGSVVQVGDRSSMVELADISVIPKAGTRGEVLIPRERLEVEPPPPEPVVPPVAVDPPAGEAGGEATGETVAERRRRKRRWRNSDQEYEEGMPLLARVKPETPSERDMQITGRLTLSGDATWSTEGNRNDNIGRVGADVLLENPFGRGGGLHIDAELNHLFTQLPDQNGENVYDGRIERVSYFMGGTRFSPNRLEVGRFLQNGMPEFGVLDGLEWNRRLGNGDRLGASVGYMPEPDDDMASGRDLQFSAFYDWTVGKGEQFSLGGGVQKTYHNNVPDRDLFVGRMRYLPAGGWDFYGTAWVDFYGASDNAKDADVEVTQAIASTGRTWETGNALNLSYRRLRFPEIDRNEFTPILAADLADNRYDRLSLGGWLAMTQNGRLHSTFGLWNDEEETGGDLEAGLEVKHFLLEGSRADFSLFGTRGQFSGVFGGRASYGRFSDKGYWSVAYEMANHRQDGFANDRDDIIQYFLRMNADRYTRSGWTFGLRTSTLLYDDELSWSVGAIIQRNF